MYHFDTAPERESGGGGEGGEGGRRREGEREGQWTS